MGTIRQGRNEEAEEGGLPAKGLPSTKAQRSRRQEPPWGTALGRGLRSQKEAELKTGQGQTPRAPYNRLWVLSWRIYAAKRGFEARDNTILEYRMLSMVAMCQGAQG